MGGGMGQNNNLFTFIKWSKAVHGNVPGLQIPGSQPNQETEIITSTDEVSKKKSVAKRSSRRQTLLTRENQLGAGNINKKSSLG